MVKRSFLYEFTDLSLQRGVEQKLGEREEKELVKVFKVCSRCGERKGLFHFTTDKRNGDGRMGICKICRSRESLKFYYENREELLIKIKEYRDKQDRTKYFADYQKDHKEHLKKVGHRWYMKNRKRIKKERGIKMISQDKFNAYIEVQYSGATNMFDLDEVLRINKLMSEIELTKRELHYIMRNYKKLKERYGIGGVNINIQSIK